MGIRGLTTFMERRFTKWNHTNLEKWNHLIMDGSSICYTLYGENCTWCLGGEYKQFRETVEKFFAEAGFKHPIVIFDGAGLYDQRKMKTQCQRRAEFFEELCTMQGQKEWDPMNPKSRPIVPLLLISVFMDVLRSLNIEFHVADGEADREIAALANHYKCPAMTSDSDFFLFELIVGFIHFDRYYCKKNDKSLYCISEFKKQFSLEQYELCLILPLVFGNDFVQQGERRSFNDYGLFLDRLAKYKTCEDYLAGSDNVSIRENFEVVKKQYCDLELPAYYTTKNPAPDPNLPPWVIDSLKNGRFPTYLLGVYHNMPYILPKIIEVISENSAWKISRYIRRQLYGLMGISADVEIKEVIRSNTSAVLAEEAVLPKSLKIPINIQDRTFIDKKSEKLSEVVLSVLKCYKLLEDAVIQREFDSLPEKWKLPIAATIYWYQAANIPSDLVKSLLISFLTCSGELKAHVPPLEPVTSYTKSDHLLTLHAFAQWQCVYFDARALNFLAREPFPTTSPAYLYSGEVAMYYASLDQKKQNVDDAIVHGSEEWKLYSKFLSLVTGYNAEGTMLRKHAKHQPEHEAPPTKRVAPSS